MIGVHCRCGHGLLRVDFLAVEWCVGVHGNVVMDPGWRSSRTDDVTNIYVGEAKVCTTTLHLAVVQENNPHETRK